MSIVYIRTILLGNFLLICEILSIATDDLMNRVAFKQHKIFSLNASKVCYATKHILNNWVLPATGVVMADKAKIAPWISLTIILSSSQSLTRSRASKNSIHYSMPIWLSIFPRLSPLWLIFRSFSCRTDADWAYIFVFILQNISYKICCNFHSLFTWMTWLYMTILQHLLGKKVNY